jgi:hypothetical protein
MIVELGLNLRHVGLLVLILVEIPLDELLKVSKSHLPSLTLLHLHLIKAGVAQATSHVLFKSVIQKGTATQAAGADGGFLHPQRLE